MARLAETIETLKASLVQRRRSTEVNEALLLALVRQHELTEEAERITARLHTEMAQRKRMEEALIASEKLAAAGRMAAVLAHEINNPLAAVMDLIYLAKTQENLPEPVLLYLQTADEELLRVAHITRQTLGFYREMSSPATFSVQTLLRSVQALYQSRITAKQAEIAIQCDDDLALSAVHGEVRQVLSNLIANSLHAIEQHGRVTMRASASHTPGTGHNAIRISVADNGPGIGQVTLQRLFEPFFTTKGNTGNGLGLWVSRELIQRHGGTLRIRSSTLAMRHGITVSLTLPAAFATPVPPADHSGDGSRPHDA